MLDSVKVSIIIPVYNASSFIDKCLESILSQKLNGIEIICVNDASTDNSLDILRKYEQQYNNIIVLNHETNKRQGGARNSGLKVARGEYVGFVDSDDTISPDMYEDLYAEAKHYNLDVVESDYDIIYTSGKVSKKAFLFTESLHNTLTDDARRRLITRGGSVWCKLYKKSFIVSNELFFPENLLYEDNYFVPLVYSLLSSYSYLKKIHYYYLVNIESTVHKKNTDNLYSRFIISELLINRFKKLQIDSKYFEELEYILILNGFTGMIRSCMLSYTYINYDLLNKSADFCRTFTPSFKCNKWYIMDYSITEKFLHRVFLRNIKIYTILFKVFILIETILKRIRK